MGGRRSYKSNRVIGNNSKGFRKTKKDILKAIEEEDSKKIVENSVKAIIDSDKQKKEFADLINNIDFLFNPKKLETLDEKKKETVSKEVDNLLNFTSKDTKKEKDLLDSIFDEVWEVKK